MLHFLFIYREGKRLFSMRKRETRQKILLQSMDFVCFCDFCKKQENESTSEGNEFLTTKLILLNVELL